MKRLWIPPREDRAQFPDLLDLSAARLGPVVHGPVNATMLAVSSHAGSPATPEMLAWRPVPTAVAKLWQVLTGVTGCLSIIEARFQQSSNNNAKPGACLLN